MQCWQPSTCAYRQPGLQFDAGPSLATPPPFRARRGPVSTLWPGSLTRPRARAGEGGSPRPWTRKAHWPCSKPRTGRARRPDECLLAAGAPLTARAQLGARGPKDHVCRGRKGPATRTQHPPDGAVRPGVRGARLRSGGPLLQPLSPVPAEARAASARGGSGLASLVVVNTCPLDPRWGGPSGVDRLGGRGALPEVLMRPPGRDVLRATQELDAGVRSGTIGTVQASCQDTKTRRTELSRAWRRPNWQAWP